MTNGFYFLFFSSLPGGLLPFLFFLPRCILSAATYRHTWALYSGENMAFFLHDLHIESEQKLEPELGTLLFPLELAWESVARAGRSKLIVLFLMITEEGSISWSPGFVSVEVQSEGL